MPRARKSLDDHKLTGTKPEWTSPDVVIGPSRPRFPKGLTPEARRVFKAISQLLERRRSLTEADGELIRILALTHVRHSKAIEKLAEEGEIKIYYRLDKFGEQVPSERPNLWLDVAQACEKQMISIYDRLGCTPLSRGKVKQVDAPKVKPSDAADDALLSREAPAPDEIRLEDIREDLIQ
jgi:P27 family predicted phage terminase small subunit